MIIRIALVTLCVILAGCNISDDGSSITNPSLTNFLKLHKQFCESDFDSPKALVSALSKADGFKPFEANVSGIFETVVNHVSYAVSSEESGCTTDLKLKVNNRKTAYFDFDDLHNALLSEGYTVKGEKQFKKQIGLDSEVLGIVEINYLSPKQTETTLVFPLEHEDQYYMTLFAKKFQSKNHKRGYMPIHIETHEI